MQPEDSIRRATPEDARAIAAIHIAGWKTFYRGRLPEEMLAGLDLDRRVQGWRQQLERARDPRRDWVIERGGEVVGFCSTDRSSDPDSEPSMGEVSGLYLRPEVVGTGAGRAVFSHAVAELKRQGFARATLWVLGSNQLGRHFYEAAGWRPDGTEKDEAWGNHVLHEVRYAIDL